MVELKEDALYAEHFREIEDRIHRGLVESGFDTLVLHSGSHRPRSTFDDQDWPLRVVPAFNHLVYWPAPDAFLILKAGARTRLAYLKSESFWEASFEPNLAPLESLLDAEPLKSREEARRFVPDGRVAFVGEDLALGTTLGIRDLNPSLLLARLEDARVKKTNFELECQRRATHRAVRGHQAAQAAFLAGERSELRLHLEYLEASEQDAFETPYQNIVALGEAAATLHYVNYVAATKPRAESFLIDAGASWLGYASDITRSYAAPGPGPASAFRDLILAMERLQAEVINAIRVGNAFEALHDFSHECLADVLIGAGIAKPGVSKEALVSERITRTFCPHGLGHSLGLQVHDVGCRRTPPTEWNPFLRNTSLITAGQVFTIEPGLYFIPSLLGPLRAGPKAELVDWDTVEALSPFGGIRIEDNIAVHEDRIENLTRDAF